MAVSNKDTAKRAEAIGSNALYGGALNYDQFRKLFPATRIYQQYTSEQRSNHAASFRLGHRQRYASGEYYYTHILIPDRAFDTAKEATTRAYDLYLAQFNGEVEARSIPFCERCKREMSPWCWGAQVYMWYCLPCCDDRYHSDNSQPTLDSSWIFESRVG